MFISGLIAKGMDLEHSDLDTVHGAFVIYSVLIDILVFVLFWAFDART